MINSNQPIIRDLMNSDIGVEAAVAKTNAEEVVANQPGYLSKHQVYVIQAKGSSASNNTP
jgi:hypothetical protein